MVGPALGVEHLPGAQPLQAALGAVGAQGALAVVVPGRPARQPQHRGGEGGRCVIHLPVAQQGSGVGLGVEQPVPRPWHQDVGETQLGRAPTRRQQLVVRGHQGEGAGTLLVFAFLQIPLLKKYWDGDDNPFARGS